MAQELGARRLCRWETWIEFPGSHLAKPWLFGGHVVSELAPRR